MRSSKWFLRTALALPILILVGVGLRAWQLEGAQVELDYQSSLRSLVLGVVSRLERWQAGEPWPGERLAGAAAAAMPAARDRNTQDYLVLLGAGLDRAVRERGHEGGLDWLQQQEPTDDAEIRAWLQLRRAGLQRKLGHAEAARTIWRELAARRGGGRDERGIRFDLTARALLLFEQPSAADAASLAVELAADQRDANDLATAVLADRVLQEHARLAPDQHDDVLTAVQELQYDAAWRSLRATLEQTTTGTSRLTFTVQHGGWLLAFDPVPAGNARIRGIPRSQLRGDLFSGTTADLIAELGIRVDLTASSGEQLATSNVPGSERPKDSLLRQDLPSGLGTITIATDPTSQTAGRRTERRMTWLLAIGFAVLAAFVAGVFGLRALRQQEQLNEQRAGFVAAVSHELKTPLTATRLLGELLERGDLDEAKVREFGGRIARESERLDQLVRNVLDLARVERLGLEPGQKSLVAPAEMWHEAIARHQQAVPGSPAVLLVQPGDAAWRVHADRESLMGAFANLLENGARHARESDQLEVAICRSGSRLRLEVRDRGPGVEDTERQRIFGEFYRGGNEDTRKTRGTGIGLALVARIASAHHGRAYCEARQGGGSVFVIEIPLASTQQGATAESHS